jgi:HPt (histidine-containing phosphotransfer) domain-containing protein
MSFRPYTKTLLLSALLGGVAFVTVKTAEQGLRENASSLTEAKDLKQLVTENLSLVYQQDDATKAMLISPESIEVVSEAKIDAYDKQKEIMKKIKALSDHSPEIQSLLSEQENLDEQILKPVDSELLEHLLAGEKEGAKELYFKRYLPLRQEYASLAVRLKELAETSIQEATSKLEHKNHQTIRLIQIATLSMIVLFTLLQMLNIKRRNDKKSQTRLKASLEISQQFSKANNLEEMTSILRKRMGTCIELGADSKLDIFLLSQHGTKTNICIEETSKHTGIPCYKIDEILSTNDPVIYKNQCVILPLVTDKLQAFLYLTSYVSEKMDDFDTDFFKSIAQSFCLQLDNIFALEKIRENSEALAKREAAMRLILDSIQEGLIPVALNGEVLLEYSKSAENWFGTPSSNMNIVDFLFPDQSKERENFEFHFCEILRNVLPFELSSDQVPSRLVRDGKHFNLAFKQLLEGENFAKVLVVVSDMTASIESHRKEIEAQETQNIVEFLLRDKNGFHTFVKECQELFKVVLDSQNLVTIKRAIHTLKGNCSVFGLNTLSTKCHELESIIENRGHFAHEDSKDLQIEWHRLNEKFQIFLSESTENTLTITYQHYARLTKDLENCIEHAAILKKVHHWKDIPTKQILERLSKQATRIGQTLGKNLEVQIEDNDVRIPPQRFDAFFSSLIHVIRNAIDHGIEARESRSLFHKKSAGTLVLSTLEQEGMLIVEVSDDGAGIQVERLISAAQSRGLEAKDEKEALMLIFHDGLSTKNNLTEVSGRGVGMGAVKEAVEKCGGRIEVTSKLSHGARFRFFLPLSKHQNLDLVA